MNANVEPRFRRRLLSACIVVVAGASGSVLAQDERRERAAAEFGAWLSHAESDNIARVLDGGRGSYDALGLLIGFANDSTRVHSSFDADIEFRHYSGDNIDDEPVGTADALVDFAIVPERFTFYLRDTYGQGQTDPFATIGPENRESVNVLAAGPDVSLPLGQRTSLDIGADYMDRSYGASVALDSTSTGAEVGLFRQSRETTRYGVVVRSSEVEYDGNVSPYEIEGAVLRYERTLASGDVMMEVGRNNLIIEDVEEDGPTANFSWSRAVGSHSSLRVSAAREFTDSGSLLGPPETEEIGVSEAAEVVLSVDPLERRRFDVGYLLDLSRTDVAIVAETYEDSFVGDSMHLDNNTTTTSLSVVRDVTARLDVGLRFETVNREFPFVPREDRDESLALSVHRELSRRFDLRATLERYERSGTESFDERRYEIRVVYSPTP